MQLYFFTILSFLYAKLKQAYIYKKSDLFHPLCIYKPSHLIYAIF